MIQKTPLINMFDLLWKLENGVTTKLALCRISINLSKSKQQEKSVNVADRNSVHSKHHDHNHLDEKSNTGLEDIIWPEKNNYVVINVVMFFIRFNSREGEELKTIQIVCKGEKTWLSWQHMHNLNKVLKKKNISSVLIPCFWRTRFTGT